MPEYNGSKNILIGAMTIAMIVIIITFVVSQISGTVSQTQTAQLVQVHAVLGTVEKISGQEITLKDVKKILNTGGAPIDWVARMVITVDQSTVVERFMRKDMLVFAKELDAFSQNKARSTSTPPKPPAPYTLGKVTFSDIKVGDIVTVSSLKDIATLTTFTATTIAIQN